MTQPTQVPPTVQLSEPFRRDHPWIFQRAVRKPEDRIPPGSVVRVMNPDGSFVGQGFYNGHARIGVRLLTRDQTTTLDAQFIARRLDTAIALRRDVLKLDAVTNAYRLVNAEGDGMSGLVIDRYDDLFVMEFFSAGWMRQREVLKQLLTERFPGSTFYWFAERRVQKQESFDLRDDVVPTPRVITEHGLKFQAAPGTANKTGFFPDQRDNRLRLAAWCKYARVADLCSHTGGFAIYAKALGGARHVTGVDLDAAVVDLARANAALNGLTPETTEFVTADVFQWLADQLAKRELYDVVVLDPAKQTRSADRVDAALAQYAAMNREAMKIVKPGGLLLTCSCSGLISEEAFLVSLRRAAQGAGRSLQILSISGAAPDHPFHVNVPETRYLKAVWARVE
jgi:23S rRNA (cytosine1962-C5)-methyltransferase